MKSAGSRGGDPVHVNDLQATMLHLLGIDYTKLNYMHQGAAMRLTSIAREASVLKNMVA